MSKDRVEPCVSYISEGNPCEEDRIATHRKYCQKCKKYKPRTKLKHPNIKKQKLQKIKESDGCEF